MKPLSTILRSVKTSKNKDKIEEIKDDERDFYDTTIPVGVRRPSEIKQTYEVDFSADQVESLKDLALLHGLSVSEMIEFISISYLRGFGYRVDESDYVISPLPHYLKHRKERIRYSLYRSK